MGGKTGIQWTESTWNPVTGCTKVSQGCKNCYAKHQAWPRLMASPGTVYFGREFEQVATHEGRLDQPLRWTKPRRIFVNSMSDLFHEDVPDDFIVSVFATMALAPRHQFQVLTKRPERMLAWLTRVACPRRSEVLGRAWSMLGKMPRYVHEGIMQRPWPLPNVWLGVSVEDQATADERIPLLLQTPAAVRWISAEPLLGPVDLLRWMPTVEVAGEVHEGIDWVVAGGESGKGARSMVLGWAKDIVRQCAAAGVPAYMKQIGARPTNREGEPHAISDHKGAVMVDWPETLRVREYPSA